MSSNRKCFWLDETHEVKGGFQLNIVTENEDGYSAIPVVVRVTNATDAKAYVAVLNDQLFGLSPADTSKIIMSSMFPDSRTDNAFETLLTVEVPVVGQSDRGVHYRLTHKDGQVRDLYDGNDDYWVAARLMERVFDGDDVHAPGDTRQAWTVIGYTENYGAEYAVGSVKGHHNAFGDDDPAGIGTWAEWVWTEDDSDGNAPGRIALAQRAAERGE